MRFAKIHTSRDHIEALATLVIQHKLPSGVAHGYSLKYYHYYSSLEPNSPEPNIELNHFGKMIMNIAYRKPRKINISYSNESSELSAINMYPGSIGIQVNGFVLTLVCPKKHKEIFEIRECNMMFGNYRARFWADSLRSIMFDNRSKEIICMGLTWDSYKKYKILH